MFVFLLVVSWNYPERQKALFAPECLKRLQHERPKEQKAVKRVLLSRCGCWYGVLKAVVKYVLLLCVVVFEVR